MLPDLEKKLGWVQDQNQTESNGEGWVIVKWYKHEKTNIDGYDRHRVN